MYSGGTIVRPLKMPSHFDLRAAAHQAMLDDGFLPDLPADSRAEGPVQPSCRVKYGLTHRIPDRTPYGELLRSFLARPSAQSPSTRSASALA